MLIDQLVNLRAKIIDEYYTKQWREVWFFPRYKEIEEVKNVMGYLGTDPIAFLSINPSFSVYPTKQDIFYYKLLQKYGFANAHLSDLLKTKVKGDIQETLKDRQEILRATKILKEELEIIKPKLIVCLGITYTKTYKAILGNLYPPEVIKVIPHYAPQFNNDEKRKNFELALENIKTKYSS